MDSCSDWKSATQRKIDKLAPPKSGGDQKISTRNLKKIEKISIKYLK